jgi:hypothetical protein
VGCNPHHLQVKAYSSSRYGRDFLNGVIELHATIVTLVVICVVLDKEVRDQQQ